ncbi:uncharacterized protein [Macrobrachium rosenbergii]|uniref:uncharacterized protein n=1 Tax=Macrobrachium rosenbergii TaxID=79674 RepID=UPI0034D709C9
MVLDARERDLRRPYQFFEFFARHHHQESQPEQTPRDTQQRLCRSKVIWQAAMKYNVALASIVPWAIAIFTLIQLGETFLVGILIISFACYSGWLVTRLVQFVQNYEIQQLDDARDSPASLEPPPYEIVVAKPPPYNELYDLSILSPGHSHSHIAVHSPHGHSSHHASNVPFYLVGRRERPPCTKCQKQNTPFEENQGLPTYEQALTMMAQESAVNR